MILELLNDPLIRKSAYQGMDHSHPDGVWQPSSSSLPYGDPGRKQGDIGFAAMVEKLYPNTNPVFRIFNVSDGTYFNYNSQTFLPIDLDPVEVVAPRKSTP